MAFLLGTVGAFVGIFLPGMLNMTAVSISVKNGKRAGLLFAAGMSITTSMQAFVAFGFADYLRRHPEVLEQLHQLALFLFVVLAIVFLYKGQNGETIRTRKVSGRKHFGAGIMMGTLNALSVLYLFALGTVLVSRNLVQTGIGSVIFFSLGAGLGAFFTFWLYVNASSWISKNAAWFTRNVNYVIGWFFVFLALLQCYNMYGPGE